VQLNYLANATGVTPWRKRQFNAWKTEFFGEISRNLANSHGKDKSIIGANHLTNHWAAQNDQGRATRPKFTVNRNLVTQS
jgi:hypothetical protein